MRVWARYMEWIVQRAALTRQSLLWWTLFAYWVGFLIGRCTDYGWPA